MIATPPFTNPLHPLILQSLHVETSAETRRSYLALSEQEWIDLIREAIRLRLAHALDQFLLREPDIAEQIPKNCQARLTTFRRQTLMLNLKRQVQLRQLLNALDAEQIPCLLMKGLWIVEILYGNLAARRSGDIDLLFKPEDMPRFTRLVKRLGYSLDASIDDMRVLVPMGHEFPLVHPKFDVTFDIHWAITRPVLKAPINEAEFWDRARDYPMAGGQCRSFDLEDHILVVSHHAAEHHRFQYVGPRALLDMAQAFRTPPRPIDWPLLIQRAEDLGWMRGLSLMLDLVRDLFGISIPEWDRRRPENLVATPEVRQMAIECMLLDQDSYDAIGGRVVRLLDGLTWQERLRHLRGRFMPPPEFILHYFSLAPHQLRGQIHLLWLYVRRWAILLMSNLPRLFALLRGDPARRAELQRSTRLRKWLEGS